MENSLKLGQFIKSRYAGLVSDEYVIDEVSFNLFSDALLVSLPNVNQVLVQVGYG